METKIQRSSGSRRRFGNLRGCRAGSSVVTQRVRGRRSGLRF